MGSTWDVMAAGTYWVLVALWSFIFLFCAHRLWAKRITNRLVVILLIVLAIDAFRTVVESVHFGLWYASSIGYIPYAVGAFLTRPDVVIFPKLLTVTAAVIILFLVLRRWLPQEERELALEAERAADLEKQVEERTRDWHEAVNRLERELDHQRVLMNELDHRVKNNLASVITIAKSSLSGKSEIEQAQSSLVDRLHAMARAYDSLAESRWEAVSIQLIAERCIYAHVLRDKDVTIAGPMVRLAAGAVSAVGLIFNELTTNAVRHGALSHEDGSLRLTWMVNGVGELVIEWRERSSHPIDSPDEAGFGLDLVRGLVRHDLHGTIEHRFADAGFEATLTIPADRLCPAASAAEAPAGL